MPFWRCCVAAGGLALAGLVSLAVEPAPPHPTALLVEYKGALHPVVAVEKELPVIMVDGRRVVVHGRASLATERLAAYRGLKATISDIRMGGVQVVAAMSETDVPSAATQPGATLGGFVEFAGTITADQDLADCYLALIAVDEAFMQGATDRPNAHIRVRQLKDLRAGEATRIKFTTAPFLHGTKFHVFGLLFSEGSEVITPQATSAWRYFHRREQVIHAAAVKRWLEENRGNTRPVQPVLQIPPRFEATDGFPRECTAMLTISPAGTVSAVELSAPLPDPAADRILRDVLHTWLFLPLLKDGVATASHVTVPLTFY